MKKMNLAVVGTNGRMGRNLIKAIHNTKDTALSACLVRSGSNMVGCDAGELAGIGNINVKITDDENFAFQNIDAVLDFTSPGATMHYINLTKRLGIIHVIGTTGFNSEEEEKIKQAALHIAVVKSENMSLGINLLTSLVAQAANVLDSNGFDIEIMEMHHKYKVDAPSGTALLLGMAAAKGRGINFDKENFFSQKRRNGPRTDGEIGFATLRGGTVIGDHTVILAGKGERIEISHKAEDRSIFAYGAIKAALWAYNKEPGYYSMNNVIDTLYDNCE